MDELLGAQRTYRSFLCGLVLGVGVLAATGAEAPVTLVHVHGLSYSADGKQLLIPSHDGVAVYEHGRWSKPAWLAHDYMGFSVTRNALYSGHAAAGSGLASPFGVIKSSDGGRSWQTLGLQGESDFHILATSFGTNAVYVANPEPNTRMRRTGIHYTLNDGLEWQRADAAGLGEWLHALAVHPAGGKLVAAATDAGLYLSRDAAHSFRRLPAGGRMVLAVTFDFDGQHLWFSTYEHRPALLRTELDAGAKPEAVPLPPLTEDAVAFIAQNPVRHNEIAIATFGRNVYVSGHRGKAWTQIAREGETLR